LVAFHELAVGHLALAVRAPALLLDARLTLGVELVEGDGFGGLGRREHLHRDADQADLEVALPCRSWWHTHDIIGLRSAMYRLEVVRGSRFEARGSGFGGSSSGVLVPEVETDQ